jgi:hypothetical protein
MTLYLFGMGEHVEALRLWGEILDIYLMQDDANALKMVRNNTRCLLQLNRHNEFEALKREVSRK